MKLCEKCVCAVEKKMTREISDEIGRVYLNLELKIFSDAWNS